MRTSRSSVNKRSLGETLRNGVSVLFAACYALSAPAADGPVALLKFDRIDPLVLDDSGSRVKSPGDIVLINDKPTVKDWTPLYVGDRVRIVGTGVAIRVRYDSGRADYLDSEGLRQTTIEKPATAGEMTNLASWVASLKRSTTRVTVSGLSRSDGEDEPCSTPSWINENDSNIESGPKPLFLVWSGGKGPFTIRRLAVGNIEEGSAIVPFPQSRGQLVDLGYIKAGPVILQIVDSTGTSCLSHGSVRLQAVDALAMPGVPTELSRAGLKPEVTGVLYAKYVQSEYGRQWDFELLRRLAPYQDREQAVRTWIDSISFD